MTEMELVVPAVVRDVLPAVPLVSVRNAVEAVTASGAQGGSRSLRTEHDY